KSVTTSSVSCSSSVSLRWSWILPMKKTSIMNHTSSLTVTVLWAEIMDFVTSIYNPSVRSVLAADIPNIFLDTESREDGKDEKNEEDELNKKVEEKFGRRVEIGKVKPKKNKKTKRR
ncbi:15216_t:CDS:2, partial [Rhizophagus irregularis]